MKIAFVLKEAAAGLRANMTMAVAMVVTTALSLALITTGFILTDMTQRTKEMYIDKVEVMIQFNDEISTSDKDCSTPQCSSIKSKLEQDSSVESLTFRNKEQSYQRFVELFADSDPRLVQQTSPDALPAALHVRLTDPTDVRAIDAVRESPGVATIIDQGKQVQEATHNLDAVRNAAFIVAALQAVASIFLMMNMVQIAAYHRRSEVSIMRMVGATRWFTQGPFVLEVILAACAGAVLSVAGLWAAKSFVVDRAMASLYDANLVARVTSADVLQVAPLVGAAGVLVAALTAQVTLRVYVKGTSKV